MRIDEVINEGAWSFPDSPEKVQKLKDILSKHLPASKAPDILHDILGNDTLFDEIASIEKEHGDVCVRDHVMQWLRHNYYDTFTQLAKSKDWEGMVRKEDELIDDEGLQSPMGHSKMHTNQ